jgi:hypothetical protein
LICSSNQRIGECQACHGELTPTRFNAIVIASLLLFGLYFPTSIDGSFSRMLAHIGFLLCLVLLFLIARTIGLVSFSIYMSFFCIVPLLLLFTYTSGMRRTALVETIGFGVLAFVYSMKLERMRLPEWIVRFYAVVNIINITAGLMILAGSESVNHFLVDHYSAFYPELVPNMLLLRKPVLTFATHSLAGFFFYLFFYASFQTYKLNRKGPYLAFSVCYVFLMIALLSNSGLILAALGTLQILYHFWFTSRHKSIWVSIIVLVTCAAAGFQVGFRAFNPVIETWNNAAEVVDTVIVAPESGFISRWGPGGIMSQDIEYLKQHPFSPIGTGMREGWTPGDIGFMNYLLMGSVMLVVFVYGGLFYFLKRTLKSKGDAYFLFCAIVLFELGFSTLTYFRMLYLLPFFVIYLNGLRPPPSITCDGVATLSDPVPIPSLD